LANVKPGGTYGDHCAVHIVTSDHCAVHTVTTGFLAIKRLGVRALNTGMTVFWILFTENIPALAFVGTVFSGAKTDQVTKKVVQYLVESVTRATRSLD
jgi:hypothetical protein